MAVIGIRQLSRNTSQVIKEFEATGEPVIVTREGRPIGALVPVDQSQLQDLVLATAPEFRESHERAKADVEEGATRSLADAARERGIELPERQQGVAAEPIKMATIEYAHLAAERELTPLAKSLSDTLAGRMVSGASEEIETLSDEALGAIGDADPGEGEVRELTDVTAAAYAAFFRRHFVEKLARNPAEDALEASSLQTGRAMRVAMNKSLVNPGQFSFNQYVASLRGMTLAWEVEADADEDDDKPMPLQDTVA